MALQTQAVREVEHGIVLVNESTRTAHVNPVAARILRIPDGTCRIESFRLGLGLLMQRSSNAPELEVEMYRLLASPESRISKWLWHLTDPPCHLHVSVAPLKADGIRGRVWVFHDVSELFDALRRVERLEHQLNHLLTEGDVIAFRLRRGGVFEWVSQSTVRMMGFSADEYIGRNATEFCHPGDVPMFYQTVKELRSTGRPQNIGIRVSDSGGRLRHLEGRVFLAQDDRDCLDVILSDVTSHVELEELRTKLTSVANHELKTPLAFMTTGLAMLEDGTIDASSQDGREVVDRMHSAAVRLARMSDDLLGLQKMEITRSAVAHTAVPVHETVARAVSIVLPERGISVEVGDSSNGVLRFVDPDLLQQAVINLVVNAIHHSPDNAIVDVEVMIDGDLTTITVRDRGPGVPEESRDAIFQPFVRRRGDRHGAGLGLAIVDRIAKVHRGSASVSDPDDGVGSVFVLTLNDLGAHT